MLDFAAVKLGFGITGVATATLIAYVINSAVLLSLALAGIGDRGPARLFATLGRLFAPLALALGLAFGLERWMPWAHSGARATELMRLGLSALAYGVVYAVCVRPLTQGMGMLQVISEFNVPVLGRFMRRPGPGAPPREDE